MSFTLAISGGVEFMNCLRQCRRCSSVLGWKILEKGVATHSSVLGLGNSYNRKLVTVHNAVICTDKRGDLTLSHFHFMWPNQLQVERRQIS